MKTEQWTEDQKFCVDVLAKWLGGHHHLPAVKEWGNGVAICYAGDLSTFDFDRLTRLVILAHAKAVRIELNGAAPRYIRIIAHRRKHDPNGEMYERHPTLDDLKAIIDRESLAPKPACTVEEER